MTYLPKPRCGRPSCRNFGCSQPEACYPTTSDHPDETKADESFWASYDFREIAATIDISWSEPADPTNFYFWLGRDAEAL